MNWQRERQSQWPKSGLFCFDFHYLEKGDSEATAKIILIWLLQYPFLRSVFPFNCWYDDVHISKIFLYSKIGFCTIYSKWLTYYFILFILFFYWHEWTLKYPRKVALTSEKHPTRAHVIGIASCLEYIFPFVLSLCLFVYGKLCVGSSCITKQQSIVLVLLYFSSFCFKSSSNTVTPSCRKLTYSNQLNWIHMLNCCCILAHFANVQNANCPSYNSFYRYFALLCLNEKIFFINTFDRHDIMRWIRRPPLYCLLVIFPQVWDEDSKTDPYIVNVFHHKTTLIITSVRP